MMLLGQSLTLQAELIEIADHGGVSTSTYFERITLDDPIDNTAMGELPHPLEKEQYALINRLPIKSKRLSPGRVKARQWKRQAFMGSTIALIGYDKVSVKWLRLKKQQLQEQGALIMMVNVQTPEQVEKVQALLPDNSVLAIPGDDVARQLDIKHYPVLITSKGIEQ